MKIWVVLALCVGSLAGESPGGALFFLALGLLWMSRDVVGRRGARVVLLVEHGRLTVQRGRMADLHVKLDRLEDVRLDTKAASKELTVSRADGVNSAFGMGSGHSIDIDIARIELVTEHEVLRLHEEFLSHLKSSEMLREVRRFLRAQGWIPLGEREESPAAPARQKKRRAGSPSSAL